jgi:hypothetical protein
MNPQSPWCIYNVSRHQLAILLNEMTPDMIPFHETMVTSGSKQIGIQPHCLGLPRLYPVALSSISVTEGDIGRRLEGYGGPLAVKRRPQSAPARIFKHVLVLFLAKVLAIVVVPVQNGTLGKAPNFA